MIRGAIVALLFVVVASPASAQNASCSTLQQVTFVRDVMSDVYLWRDRIQTPDPAAFASPEAYLDAVRLQPLDASFSYVTSRAASDAYFESSRYEGLGLSTVWRGDDLVVSQVFPSSPASEGGVGRGDRVVEVAGTSVSVLRTTGRLAAALAGVDGIVELTIESRAASRRLRLTRRSVVIPSVGEVRLLDVGGRRVGYLLLRNFVEPTVAELDDAFRVLKAGAIADLVLDLRYNSGGLVTVARHLAGLVGGPLTNGQVFARYRHNVRHGVRDRAVRFRAPDQALRLTRLFVIASGATASASELLINGLRPFIPVVLVGERTFGKPVGQYLITFCDRVLAPVSFALENADGEGAFFSGLEPSCVADDDLSRELGDPQEDSLRKVLEIISRGSCVPSLSGRRLPLERRAAPERVDGWSQLLGAH